MKNHLLGAALCVSLAACGDGNPFTGDGGTVDVDGDVNSAGIPTVLARDLQAFTYNPATSTLVISGVTAEDSAFEATYTRRPGLDRGGYEAYTQQDGSLDRHSTAYVRNINGTVAAIAVTGGQFGYYFSGGAYGNASYSAPIPVGSTAEGGLVQYAGNYVGLLNGAGSGEDLLPVAGGTEPSFLPAQAAEVTGRILITASFSDGSVSGIVTDRSIVDAPAVPTADIELAPTEINADGTFLGDATQESGTSNVGSYGGIFGGTGATEIAGVVAAGNHIDSLDNIEEVGVFVLGACGTAAQDPVCNQPVP